MRLAARHVVVVRVTVTQLRIERTKAPPGGFSIFIRIARVHSGSIGVRTTEVPSPLEKTQHVRKVLGVLLIGIERGLADYLPPNADSAFRVGLRRAGDADREAKRTARLGAWFAVLEHPIVVDVWIRLFDRT